MEWISIVLRWIRKRKVPGFGEWKRRMLCRDSRHFAQIGNGFPAAAGDRTANSARPRSGTAIKGTAADRERQKPQRRAAGDARGTRIEFGKTITLAPIRNGRAVQASKV